jgi:DNA helicase IV
MHKERVGRNSTTQVPKNTDKGDGLSSVDDIGVEQTYVSMLYDRLDNLRELTGERLAAVLQQTGGTPQARSERDGLANRYTDQLAQFNAVENGLCFGRLDFHDGGPTYIGRIGIFDNSGDYEPLLLDWRAPAARPFYLATAVSSEGVARRRHIRTRLRTVVQLDDEVLDLEAARAIHHDGLAGESALLAALTASRTGRMKDIVATIQAEQDRVIRSDMNGVLVVQGGPGTGKTAVALHRAAYLLYTYRQVLSTRGVLIVGPNATFLRYISQVLPSLAETGVLLRTVGDLYPGVRARRTEPAEVAELKGRLDMVDVLTEAIRDRQVVPEEAIEIEVDREVLRLDAALCASARERARRSGRLHNLARDVFAHQILDELAQQVAERYGTDPYADDPLGGDDAPGDPMLFGAADLADIRRELADDPAIQATLDHLWPRLTPQRLLADLFADPDRIAAAAPQLTAAERELLYRPARGGWTAADVALLDEAMELLGEDDRLANARLEAARRERIAYAQGALDIVEGSRPLDLEDELDPEILTAIDLLDADLLADRHADGEWLTTAQRAAADRNWAFGHIVIDEAQELSPMAWRLLMRRSPSRSMTLVGDVAQTGDLAGTSSWEPVLAPHVADRWRLAELTVNYRTPAEIMDVAATVLASIDPALRPPRSVRSTGVPPWSERVDDGRIGECLAAAVQRELTTMDEGRLGVIVPAGRIDELGKAVSYAVPEAAVGEHPELESPVVVLTVRQAKGLEFDSVIVADPQGIIDESARGLSDLYVALTRATQTLGIVYDGAPPAALA